MTAVPARITRFGSGKRWEATAPWSQGVVVAPGPLIYLSGQVAIDDAGNVVGVGDLGAQTRQTFSNIRDLLETVGSSLDRIIKLTYFVTNMRQWGEVATVRGELFHGDWPASTTVEVTRLFRTEYLIEIEAIAVPG